MLYKKIKVVLQYYEMVIFSNRASSQMSVNSRGSHVDVFAHSWFEDFRLVLCFCFSWSRSLRSLFLLFLCFLLSLGCNLNTRSVTSTARHENNKYDIDYIHAHKCWPVRRLPRTDPQILKRSATLSQTENVKQKQRFRLRKNTLDLLAWGYRLRNEKVLKRSIQKNCCPKLKYSLHFTWSRQKCSKNMNKRVCLNWTIFTFGILGFDSRWKNINKQEVPWVMLHNPTLLTHASATESYISDATEGE